MLNYLSKTYLNSDAGSTKYYFIGIGALVLILIVAAAAIFFSPDLKNTLTGGQKLEKSRIAGQIVDINYDEDYFIIDDEDSGEEFLINLPDGAEITLSDLSGDRTYTLGDLELGQYIVLIGVKYTSGGGSNPGGSGNNSGGGGPNNGGDDPGDENVVDPGDWEDINIYFPFPAFSAKIIGVDTSTKIVTIIPIVKDPKEFEVLVTNETLITGITATTQENVIAFSGLKSVLALNERQQNLNYFSLKVRLQGKQMVYSSPQPPFYPVYRYRLPPGLKSQNPKHP